MKIARLHKNVIQPYSLLREIVHAIQLWQTRTTKNSLWVFAVIEIDLFSKSES
jgi:hypothetical protein